MLSIYMNRRENKMEAAGKKQNPGLPWITAGWAALNGCKANSIKSKNAIISKFAFYLAVLVLSSTVSMW